MYQVPFQVDLSKKVIAITGAGGIICGEFAKALAACGAKVGLLDINYDAAKKVAEEIGENAFSDCTALSEVRFGSGLVSISQRAFDGCTALSSVSLPEGTVFLGYRAFGGCTALADITLPASLETVEAQAFSGCDAVSGVTFNGSRARLDSLLSAGGEELLKAKEIICTDGKTK